jgi:hypothetical protein
MKIIDFPAGHSMDTDWFAVDKDGNVAVFDSGQEGAVPIEIESQTFWLELFEKYAKPITPILKQLYLGEKTIENILQKCDVDTLHRIISDEYAVDGCIFLLNEDKKWEDLDFERVLLKEKSFEDTVLCLSENMPLYLMSDIYVIRKEFVDAIKNKIIIKACNFSIFYDDEDGLTGVGKKDLGLFFYDHDSHDWRTEPYYKVLTPEIPLKASQIAPDLKDKIPHFKEMSFENQYWIQPMEFFSCNSYVEGDTDKIGYGKVTSSDNQEEYCLLPISDQIWNLTKVGNCAECYRQINSFSLYHHNLEAYKDYPPVVIIKDYYVFDYDKRTRYDNLLKQIYEKLNISRHECFITYCTKCYDSRKGSDLLRFSKKFQNCYKHLNTEISVLQPSLLIAIEESVVSMLKSKYKITDFSEMPCLCGITIEEKQYPLLVINKSKTKEQQENLDRFLSEKFDEIRTILAEPRNLPPLKPRVIRIEE